MRVARFSAEELADRSGLVLRHIDRDGSRPNVLRTHIDPRALAHGDLLRDCGFVVRPEWITWLAPADSGSAGLVELQSAKQRQRTRRALRDLAQFDLEIVQPVRPGPLSEWAQLYSGQVEAMHLGVDIFAAQRARILQPEQRHLLALWRESGRLVAGCVARHNLDRSSLDVRFSAVAPDRHGLELPRGMYARLADLAGELGVRWFSLGQDINFYGAVVKPGLCAFKQRLGLRPAASDIFRPVTRQRSVVVERVLDLHGLVAPVLRFEYLALPTTDADPARPFDPPWGLSLTSVGAETADEHEARSAAARVIPLEC